MNIKEVLIAVSFLILGGLAYYAFSVFYLNPNLAPVEVQTVPEVKKVEVSTKGKSSINLSNCDLKDYGLDCKITKYLEENLAWTNNKEGMDFCAYAFFGEKDDKIYLKVFCQEFYISKEEVICPDEATLDKCFIAKDKVEGCSNCRTQTIEPRIVQGGGISIPVKLTKKGEGYTFWTPRDGSLYSKDMKAEFPSEYIPLVSKEGKNLQSIAVERAEKYFGVKAVFNIEKTLDDSCVRSIDCPDTPANFASSSVCPHTMKCIDSKCAVGCY
ncbi:MAG: hypothetical protein PHR47_04350, partial [Candidatus Pacebacteria bacterium]|nr:hypothetical protein [Candidatus Paceibacterota bacterium]